MGDDYDARAMSDTLDRLAVQALDFGDVLGSLREALSKSLVGEPDFDATGQERVRVDLVVKEILLALFGCGEDHRAMRREPFEQHEKLADDIAPQAVRFIEDIGSPAAFAPAPGRH